MDPNFLAHQQVGALALAALEQNLMPAPVPLPGGLMLMLGGLVVLVPLVRRSRRAAQVA